MMYDAKLNILAHFDSNVLGEGKLLLPLPFLLKIQSSTG